MNKTLKTLGLGIAGGMLPIASIFAYTYFTTTPSERIFGKEHENELVKAVSYDPKTIASATSNDFTAAAASSVNAVVHVTTKTMTTRVSRDPFYEFFYGPGTGQREFKQYGEGSGSGVILSTDGYIITNNHVIDNATEVEVIMNDNRKFKATVVGTDPSTDIAVLKIEGKNFPAIAYGNSDDLKVGEWVLAVGNPFNLTSTVTAGIVSAKARNISLITERQNGNVPIESFIQTDAAVNPGNSGGALVNKNGQLIGINTAIASQTGSYSGYSFAIPFNLVKKVMTDILDFGTVQRGYLGVQIIDITQEVKDKYELPNTEGVFLAKAVEKGSVKEAGIPDESVLLKIDGKSVNSVAQLQEEIGKKRPGDNVSIFYRTKEGGQFTKSVTLQNSEGTTKMIKN
jgi:serine protease Do